MTRANLGPWLKQSWKFTNLSLVCKEAICFQSLTRIEVLFDGFEGDLFGLVQCLRLQKSCTTGTISFDCLYAFDLIKLEHCLLH